MEENIHENHRSRMREKIKRAGLNSLATHELIEYLLYYSIPRQDTNPIAHRLLKRFGSIHGILNASIRELCTIDGIGERSAELLKICAEMAKKFLQDDFQSSIEKLDSLEKIGSFCINLFIGDKMENTFILLLNDRCELLSCEHIAKGSLNSTQIDNRMIAEHLIHYEATALILTHNHPNANNLPSNEDIQYTNFLKLWLQSMNITLIDHIIVSGNTYSSIKQLGYLVD